MSKFEHNFSGKFQLRRHNTILYNNLREHPNRVTGRLNLNRAFIFQIEHINKNPNNKLFLNFRK